MEKYAFISNSIDSVPVVFGRYFALVHQKHIEAYGEIGADNIVNNIVETYKHIQIQMNNPAVSNNVLLVGKVQSGKTSNLELLTALAFDNGYNILVIYGGYDSSLLKQTTDRFMDTFDASGEITYDGEAPAIFTTDDSTQILSIDDEIMTDLLEMEGITSEWAKNGKLAVDMYAQSDVGHFDLILMDMRMPVMDGLTATREIRKLDRPDAKRIPIIALTANAFEEDMKRCLAAGMDAHLAKPVDIEQLKNEVRKVLARR